MSDDITAARIAKFSLQPGWAVKPSTTESYRVAPGPHGIAIFGSCSLVHLHGMTRIAKEEGFNETAPEIAVALAATTVFVSASSRERWRAELEREFATRQTARPCAP
jgi:hypothetical protein